jgi:hypothetical protein
MGSPGLIMSGSRDEGALLGNIKAQAQPAGRGFFVERKTGSRLIQVALVDDAAMPTRGVHHAKAEAEAGNGNGSGSGNDPGNGNGAGNDVSGGRVASHRRV